MELPLIEVTFTIKWDVVHYLRGIKKVSETKQTKINYKIWDENVWQEFTTDSVVHLFIFAVILFHWCNTFTKNKF